MNQQIYQNFYCHDGSLVIIAGLLIEGEKQNL